MSDMFKRLIAVGIFFLLIGLALTVLIEVDVFLLVAGGAAIAIALVVYFVPQGHL